MKKIAPSERIEQELMNGIVSSTDPLGEAARTRGPADPAKGLGGGGKRFSGARAL